MGAQARTLPGKIVKFVILCAAAWLLLYGLQRVLDFLYWQTDQQLPAWELQKEWWIKGPVFAIIALLIFNEKV